MSFTKGERVALWILVAALAFLAGLLVYREVVGGTYAHHNADAPHQPWWSVPDWWAVIVNFPIAMATVFLWFITRDTLKQTQRSVDLSYSQARPYLAVRSVAATVRGDPEESRLSIVVKSLGSAPLVVTYLEWGVNKIPTGKKPGRALRSAANLRKSLYVPVVGSETPTINPPEPFMIEWDKKGFNNDRDWVLYCWLTYRSVDGQYFRHYFTALWAFKKTLDNGWPHGNFTIMAEDGYWGDEQAKG